MNDLRIRDLLHEVADDTEPGDRLDAIRTATAPAGRRTRRGWWVAGAAGLVAASVVTAFALSTGGAPQTTGPDPAGPPPTSATTVTDGQGTSRPVHVYFVGDTAAGPRLFRELRSDLDPDSRVVLGIHAALGGDALDPDYRSPWPEGVVLRQWSSGPDGIMVSLEGAPVDRPADMTEEDARLALEQLVRTAQAVSGRGKVPVDVQIEQQVTDTVLGVPTTAPLTGSPDLDVLAPVSLSEPAEGAVVRRADLITVDGEAVSADGRVSLQVKKPREGAAAVFGGQYDLVPSDGPLAPFSVDFSYEGLQPGEYDVVATVENSDGTTDSDTRRITVVD